MNHYVVRFWHFNTNDDVYLEFYAANDQECRIKANEFIKDRPWYQDTFDIFKLIVEEE